MRSRLPSSFSSAMRPPTSPGRRCRSTEGHTSAASRTCEGPVLAPAELRPISIGRVAQAFDGLGHRQLSEAAAQHFDAYQALPTPPSQNADEAIEFENAAARHLPAVDRLLHEVVGFGS